MTIVLVKNLHAYEVLVVHLTASACALQGGMSGYGGMGGMGQALGGNMVRSAVNITVRSSVPPKNVTCCQACLPEIVASLRTVHIQQTRLQTVPQGHMGGYPGGVGGRGSMGSYGSMQSKMSPQMAAGGMGNAGGMGSNYGSGGGYGQMQHGTGYGPAYSEGSASYGELLRSKVSFVQEVFSVQGQRG